MKLLTLNVWGGKIYEPLIKFIKQAAVDTDIFCFQELFFGDKPDNDVNGARANLGHELEKVLSDFVICPHFAPEKSYFMKQIAMSRMGQAIFVRKNISITETGGFFTYPADSPIAPVLNHSGNFQYLKIKLEGDEFLIGNLHGLWQASGKRDTSERVDQSKNLKNFFDNYSCKKILCGDFNLRPETQSISTLEENFKNLVKEYGIATTRTHFYKDADKYNDHIADYIFVSSDIKVEDFRVLNNVVSDHLPLVIEFK